MMQAPVCIYDDEEFSKLDDCIINLLGLRSEIHSLSLSIQLQIIYRALSDLSDFGSCVQNLYKKGGD
jgi:hypothetical protein